MATSYKYLYIFDVALVVRENNSFVQNYVADDDKDEDKEGRRSRGRESIRRG